MKLRDICEYRNEKIGAEGITPESYVSTESMLPNRSGIAAAASIPTSGKVNLYHQGDTLVSNIRPYFKKIWQASRNGCCSNDILVFQPKDNCNGDYLHWVLSNETFFDYVTATAKGTKMPRGDKAAIMQFSVPDFNANQQLKVAFLLNPIQKKIELNAKLNGYLLELAAARFESALEAKSKTVKFGDVVALEDSKRVPLNSRDRKARKGPYPYYGATSVMDYVDDYLFDEIRILLGEDGTVVDSEGKPILQYVWGKYWVNNHAHILAASGEYSLEAIYVALKRTAINHVVTGAVQMKISQRNLKSLELEMPSPESLGYLQDLFTAYRSNQDENAKLASLRDTLLPKLMSGEIDVSKVDLMQLNSHLAMLMPPFDMRKRYRIEKNRLKLWFCAG